MENETLARAGQLLLGPEWQNGLDLRTGCSSASGRGHRINRILNRSKILLKLGEIHAHERAFRKCRLVHF